MEYGVPMVEPDERQREKERGKVVEGEREKKKGGKCHQSGYPEVGVPSLGHYSWRKPNLLARHSCAKRWALRFLRETEQAAPRRVTLTKSEESSRLGGEQWNGG
jgi:hypothetical protein